MKSRRIVWQIFPAYLIILLIALVAATGYTSSALRHFFLDRTAADLEARARILEESVRRHLAPLDPEAVDAVSKTAGRASGTRITVMDPHGKVLGDSHRSPSQMEYHHERPEFIAARSGRTGQSVRYSTTLNRSMMYVAVPVRRDGRIEAILRAALPVSAIDAQLRQVRWRIAGGGLLILLLAAGVSLWVSRRLSRPIQELQAGAQRFADGDLAHRIPTYDTVELAALAEAMNRMAAHLSDRIHEAIRQRMEIEAILESMNEGVMALDTEERIIRANQAVADIFGGQPPAQLLDRTLPEAIRNSELHRLVARAREKGRRVETDVPLHAPDERTLYTRCMPLRDHQDRHIGLLLVMSDVTHMRHLENMRRDFAANVSHEIKTPLTAIKGFVETLCHGDVEDSAEMRRFLGIIEKHVNRLSAIIDDLMKLSRIERDAEIRDIVLATGDIAAVVGNAVGLCREAAAAGGIAITYDAPGPLPARISAPLLEQAVVNLIENAVKFSEASATVRVAVEVSETAHRIRVTDQGPGIPRQHLPRLFERFYRADKARSRKMGGTGLGLAIVKHIAQAHGGQITVESTVGKGSTFIIELPRE